ncbi:MAG TPA: hypothetical protein VFF65_12660, partial [Phycisphaerales bacterium]|nr:hypothetical protein [Phycisphaerales bacterium]
MDPDDPVTMALLAAIAVLASALAAPDVRVDSLPALRAAVAAAKPGDRVLLAPGVYQGSLALNAVHGEKERPIVIAGADASNPPVIRGTAQCVHVSKPAYLVIENLVLERATGNGINIDDGADRSALAPGVTLRKLTVRDIGAGC